MAAVPEHLVAEGRVIEEQIRRAFRGVTRKGGVSWAGAFIRDRWGTEEQVKAAALDDVEKCWEELVDDPTWIEDPSWGGFNFVDAIGFRYYIAPAAIRCIRSGGGEFVGYALQVTGEYDEEQMSLLNWEQGKAIARFVKYMIAVHEAQGDWIYGEPWQTAWDTKWRRVWSGR
jgi:hypothetical protein